MILALILQRPLVAGVVVLVIWIVADRAWFSGGRIFRTVRRRGAISRLRARLDVNPHDRNARFELAEHLVARGRHDEALSLLEKNLEAGDDDDETLYLSGVAAYGSSAPDAALQAEDYLARAKQKSPSFRSGAIDLELGRGRLVKGRFAEAQQALEASIEARPGSVQAHVLLSRALAAQGDQAKADQTRRHAWTLYKQSPRFQRRQDRPWAWRANPKAAARYIATILAIATAIAFLAPKLVPDNPDPYGPTPYTDGSR